MYDIIIVGGGLAGACAALHLSQTRKVLLLEAGNWASGASGVAAGMMNPLIPRRARPVWRMHDALAAFHHTLDLAEAHTLLSRRGILRPAGDEQQVQWFQEAADLVPEHAQWLTASELAARYPQVVAPLGGLLVTSGGAVDVPAFVRHLVQQAHRRGADVHTQAPVTAWGESKDHAWADVLIDGATERLPARRVLLTLGASFPRFEECGRLRLHRVKGQVIRVERPAGLSTEELPHLAGAGYAVVDRDTLVVGSTFEHTFSDEQPSREQSHQLLATAAAMLPALAGADILEETAGVRVNVPGTRLPMVGPLPGRKRVWIFTGLGSKGLLMAPFIASQIAHFFEHPDDIPREIRVKETG